MSRQVLSTEKLTAALVDLPGWQATSGKLHKDFAFRDFREAFAFMSAMAITSEAMNHHPEWSNLYNRVSVDLITHDTTPAGGGLTALDVELARAMETFAARLKI